MATDIDIHEFKEKATPYALIIVTWNEGERLRKQLQRIQAQNCNIDIIITDGASNDGSTDTKLLKNLQVRTLIAARTASDLSLSLKNAFAYALEQDYQGVIMMDGNNKDDPSAINNFCKQLDARFDFIQGSRYLPGGMEENTPLKRKLLIKFIHVPLFSFAAKYRYSDTTNGFRAFSKLFLTNNKVNMLTKCSKRYELPYFLAWAAAYYKFKVTEIPVIRSYPTKENTPTKIVGLSRHWDMLKPVLLVLRLRLTTKMGKRIAANEDPVISD